MCLKGLARDSWQKGSFPTVQISVSCEGSVSIQSMSPGSRGSHGLEVLLDLRVESTGFQGDDLGGGIGVVGDGRATLGAEETVDNVARGSLGARVLLDGAIDGELILWDDSDKS